MNPFIPLLTEKPQGVDVGECRRLVQVWNYWTRENFYFCPWCKGWIRGRIDTDVFADWRCIRCAKKI